MADERDLERVVKIAAPYDENVHSEVLVESLPVWFDLGWQKVEGEDYGVYNDVEPAAADTSPSYEFRTQDTPAPVKAPSPVKPPAPNPPTTPTP